VGLLLVVFPGGIGPRELALITALAPVMHRAGALVVALMSRIVMTVADLAGAGLALAAGRLRGPTAGPAATGRRWMPGRRRQRGRHRKDSPEREPVLTGN
jgi:hypothetical protein